MKHVIIHTDGSCDKNPGGPGGWAAIIQLPDFRYEIRGRCSEPTTSNRMELTAAIEALRSLGEWCEVELITDSQYLQLGASKLMKFWHARGWMTGGRRAIGKGAPLKNADLWKQIWELCLKHNVKWKWVRGHADCEENRRADHLASGRP